MVSVTKSTDKRGGGASGSGSSQDKACGEGVGRVEQEGVLTGDVGGTRDFGNDGGAATDFGGAGDTSGEGRADETVDGDGFIEGEFPTGVMDGEATADAGSGGRTVNFTFGKDADIAAVDVGLVQHLDENGAVEEVEVGVAVGMADGIGGHDGAFDAHADVDKFRLVAIIDDEVGEGRLINIDIGIERATEGDVTGDVTEAGDINLEVGGEDEGRHVEEGDMLDLPVDEMGGGGNTTGGGVDAQGGAGGEGGKEADLQRDFDEGDDAMTAHGAEAFVVEEEHAEIAIEGDGRGEDRAVHIGVTARLEHEQAAEVVVVGAGVVTFFEDGGTGKFGKAAGDDAQGFTAGVGVDGGESEPIGGRLPCGNGVHDDDSV